MIRYSSFVLIVLGLLGIDVLWAQVPTTPHGLVGCRVVDLESGMELEESNSQILLPGASTIKLVTTMTTLGVLGGDFRYRTHLIARGALRDGNLEGNLELVGGGDPTLGSQYVEEKTLDALVDEWAIAVMKAGIKVVKGDLILVDTFYRGFVQGPDWLYRDLGNYYGSAVWSINVRDNQCFLEFERTEEVGSSCRLTRVENNIISSIPMQIDVRVGKLGSGDQTYVYGTHHSSQLTVAGTLPPGSTPFRIKAAVPNLPKVALDKLAHCLREKGVVIAGEAVWRRAPAARRSDREDQEGFVIWESTSPDLYKICKLTNERSINLYAEAILRTLGEHRRSNVENVSSAEMGIKKIKEYWTKRGVPNVSDQRIVDGSGLSPTSCTSSAFMTDVLSVLWRAYGADGRHADLIDLLAAGGREGTLARLCNETSPLFGHIWAKSGSMEGTRALVGILRARSGRYLGFSINGYQVPKNYDRRFSTERLAWLETVYANY